MEQGTGYMGMPEPEVVPKGAPSVTPQSEKTFTYIEPSAEPQPQETVAEAATPEPPAATVTEPEPKVVEKIVEKIVEKHPEFKNEESKAIYDAWVDGRMDEVKAYWREMDKDYDTMSHIDIVREGLSKANPKWTKADTELELRDKYGKQLERYDLDKIDRELDPEGYKEAEAHNDRADANMLKLERDARDFRITLKDAQQAIEIPKIKAAEPVVTPAAPTTTPEQLEVAAKEWATMAETQVSINDFTFHVGDDTNPEDVVFAVTTEEKSAEKEAMKIWNGGDMMQRRGWTNPDGTFNLQKIAEDEYVLKNNAKMVKSAYTQGVTNGRKLEIAGIKQIDTERDRNPEIPVEVPDTGNAYWS